MSFSSKINALTHKLIIATFCISLAACGSGGSGGTGTGDGEGTDGGSGSGSGGNNGGGNGGGTPEIKLTELKINATALTLDLDKGPKFADLQLLAKYSDNTETNVTFDPGTLWIAPSNGTASLNTTTLRLTALTEGNATVQARFGGQDTQITITVKKAAVVEPQPEKLTLTTTSEAFYVGNTKQVTVQCTLNNGNPCVPMPAITWSSNDNSTATVNNGLVTAHKKGPVTISAKSATLGASLPLTVEEKPITATLEQISIESADFVMKSGDTQSFSVKGLYSDGTSKALNNATWHTYNENVATVSPTGEVKALNGGFGYAFIEATADGKTATAKINLSAQSAGCENSNVSNVTFHYRRNSGDYDGWGLHLWGGAITTGTKWETPRLFEGSDSYGRKTTVAINNPSKPLNFIIHKGDVKDPESDRVVPCGVSEVWLVQGKTAIYTQQPSLTPDTVDDKAAVWSSRDTIKWSTSGSVTLYYSDTASLKRNGGTVTGGKSVSLSSAGSGTYKLPNSVNAADILKQQVWVASSSGSVTGLQIQGALDDLYKYNGELGPSFSGNIPTLRVWAPTAQSVNLRVFGDSKTNTNTHHTMTLDANTGVWSVTGDSSWLGKYYLFEVKVYVPLTGRVETNFVTDPYSVSLSMNSERSQIIDLASDETLKPSGWDAMTRNTPAHPMDWSIYELHVREFSQHRDDNTVMPSYRGKYKAFGDKNFNGVKHLERLAKAGLSHVHLLPVFDIATVNEDVAQQSEPSSTDWSLMKSSAANSTVQRETQGKYNLTDAWNWGYDPYHYGVPEGSYATNPDGTARIKEFREMVSSLNDIGLGVIMDVVYNHTSSSGMWFPAVLDRIVPGYYHRLNAEGRVQTSTCCDDTASEYAMMEKLMIDTLVRWVKYYRVDGFRFDLMGHHTIGNMVKVRDALRAVNPKVYIYGEGWSFGGLNNGDTQLGATQKNVKGTGIGAFNDLARDSISGGVNYSKHDHDGLPSTPAIPDLGIVTGDSSKITKIRQFLKADTNSNSGAPIDAPHEQVVYASAHDDLTLWDTIAFRKGAEASAADIANMQRLALDFVMFAQGVPFLDSGIEMLRSKSGDANSYDSGDWFNRLDYTYTANGWGMGFPRDAGGDKTAPTEWSGLLAKTSLKPSSTEIGNTLNRTERNLRVRKGIRLLRLQSKKEIDCMLTFENDNVSNNVPAGMIALKIHDKSDNAGKCAGVSDADSAHEEALVLFNTTGQAQTFRYAWASKWKNVSSFESGDGQQSVACVAGQYCDFTVQARYTGVFVEKQQ